MGILSRFADIMNANVNAALSKAEEKNADKLLEKYLQDAKENYGNVKAETAAIIAEEMACGRRLSDCDGLIKKYEQYAAAAVKAGNDDDARKFLAYKAERAGERAQLSTDYESAKANSEKMRQMTQKLAEDVREAQSRLQDLQSRLTLAKAQEKRKDLSGELGDGMGDFDHLFDQVQKRIDTAQAASSLGQNPAQQEIEELEKKYATETPGLDPIEEELARLKNSLS